MNNIHVVSIDLLFSPACLVAIFHKFGWNFWSNLNVNIANYINRFYYFLIRGHFCIQMTFPGNATLKLFRFIIRDLRRCDWQLKLIEIPNCSDVFFGSIQIHAHTQNRAASCNFLYNRWNTKPLTLNWRKFNKLRPTAKPFKCLCSYWHELPYIDDILKYINK